MFYYANYCYRAQSNHFTFIAMKLFVRSIVHKQ